MIYQNISADQQNRNASLHDAVRRYLDRDWCPIPVKYMTKEPINFDWPKAGLVQRENVESHFSEPMNIGIVLGDASNGLVDIDIDAPDGLGVADDLLPPTDLKFGRESSPSSHWLYRVPRSGNVRKITDHEGAMIVEVRGTAHQTVFPPSIHESGERIRFEGQLEAEPSNSTWEELVRCAQLISLAVLLLRTWHRGSRHELALAASGFLASRGLTEQEIIKIISSVCRNANDGELDDRLTCVRTTFECIQKSQPVAGEGKLSDIVGADFVKAMERCINPSSRSSTKQSASSPTDLHVAIQSDVDLSKHIAGKVVDELLHCGSTERWFHRQKQVYTPIAGSELDRLVIGELVGIADVVAPAGSLMTNQRKSLLSGAKVNNIARLLRSDVRLAVDSREFDRESLVLGCHDGSILDLDRMSLVEQSTGYVAKRLGTTFDPTARCPLWQGFLQRIFNNDQTLISFIQRAVGYTLIGTGAERSLFVLIGKGANGKSTLLRIVHKLFGEYAGGIPMHTLMVDRFGTNKTDDLASLPGKRFVQAHEADSGQRLAEAKIKMMTGGDPIACRALYKDYQTFDPQFVLWLATNEMPEISGSADAVWDRLRIIPFDVSIPAEQRDLKLLDKLASELPGILNWALDGYRQWKSQGLNPPDRVVHTGAGYRQEKDYVEQWINQECRRDPLARSASSDLFGAYQNWATNNRVHVLNNSQFGAELERKGFSRKRSAKANYFLGLCLLRDEQFMVGPESKAA